MIGFFMSKLQEIFNPTKEQMQKYIDITNRVIQECLDKYGKDCCICAHSVYVQESPYYDYLTCKFDNTIEVPGGLDVRHCCNKYEFCGFEENVI